MRKLLVLFVALTMILGAGTAAMAAYDVRTAITSEAITGTVDMCEKYGAVTFTFSTGTRIFDGDWMYFDLPRGVTLCQSFDFVVWGNYVAGVAGTAPNAVAPGATNGTLQTFGAAEGLVNGEAKTLGPWKVIDKGADGIVRGLSLQSGSGLWARVYGVAGTRRVNIAWYDNDFATDLFNALNANGSTELRVEGDTELTLTLFDGEPWNGNTTSGVGLFGKNPPPATEVPTGWTAPYLVAKKDNDKDGQYGEQANDILQNPVTGDNIWDNFICGKIDSTYNEGDRINVSFDSGGSSGDDFLTFQGQREIAHIMGATNVTLEACTKRDLCGYVALTGGQGSVCSYQYDAPFEAGYCPDAGSQVFASILNPGNLAVIQMQGGFGSTSDSWYVELEVVSGDGTYFGALSTLPKAMNTANAADLCAGPAGDQLVAVKVGAPAAWTVRTRSGAAFTGFATGAGCGVVPVGQQATRLTSPLFTIANPSQVNRLVLDIPTLVYAPSLLTNGAVATVRVKLFKAPCGQIFSADRCLANYVSSCAAAMPTTTLLYPYAVELNGASGWWYGMSFANPSNAAGTATINVYEDDGDRGVFTTPTIPAGGMMTFSGADLLSSLTPATGNTGVLGDARCHIVVNCNFGFAGGFGMMGNGQDSTGYTANGIPGNAVGNWNY